MEDQPAVTRVTSNGSGNNDLELLRERDYPFYKPAAGAGSGTAGSGSGGAGGSSGQTPGGSTSVGLLQHGSEVITNKEPSTIQHPTAGERERAGYFGSSSYSSSASQAAAARYAAVTPATVAATPSTSYAYSPAPTAAGTVTTDSSEANSEVDPDDSEHRRIALAGSDAASQPGSVPPPLSNVAATPAGQDASLAAHMDALAMEGIQVVPSTSATAPAATAPAKATAPASNTAKPAEAVTASVPTKEPAPVSNGAPPSRQSSAATATTQRPAAPEHKKSMFGKLFGKDKDKHPPSEGHSNVSSAAGSPHPTMSADSGATARPGLNTTGKAVSSSSRGRTNSSAGTRTPSASGAESDTTAASSVGPPQHSQSIKEKDHSALANLLHRRMSNKKMPQPDPSLLAMANSSKAAAASTSPGASNSTLTAPGQPGVSSTAASRGSTPDVSGVPPPVSRAGNASPARSGAATPADAGGRPMARRPSGSAPGDTKPNGTYTPTAEQHQVKEKSLKEHLAALGSAGSMIGKLNRKTSQTSRKSDDGRSEKSGGGHFYQEEPDHHAPVPKRAPSVGGQSNASTSLAQKYGICEKVAIGKGATAVVRLAHKWDRSTEKLYAVKEFRKRRKNESEKEYVKKLTSEFCISSTLHHINVVETVDLVQNEEKHWCEVMEYCPGGDLYSAIKKGTMTTEDINIYFKQIVTGVAYLHSMGVAHRDIKPENLLLDNLGHVKITDFGVSDVFRMCWEKQTHMSKGLCGSEPYIAPEQFEQKEYDARLVDVWACAVVFYCMQAQELPWRVAKPTDPSFATYLHQYASSLVPQPLGNLHPKDCRSIVKKMLDPSPKSRVNMDAVLADPFMKGIDYSVEPSHPLPLP